MFFLKVTMILLQRKCKHDSYVILHVAMYLISQGFEILSKGFMAEQFHLSMSMFL